MERREFLKTLGMGTGLAAGALVLPEVAAASELTVPANGHTVYVYRVPDWSVLNDIGRDIDVGRVWGSYEPLEAEELRTCIEALELSRGGLCHLHWLPTRPCPVVGYGKKGRGSPLREKCDELQVLFKQGSGTVAVCFTGVEYEESPDTLRFTSHRREFGGLQEKKAEVCLEIATLETPDEPNAGPLEDRAADLMDKKGAELAALRRELLARG